MSLHRPVQADGDQGELRQPREAAAQCIYEADFDRKPLRLLGIGEGRRMDGPDALDITRNLAPHQHAGTLR
ncbi:MAG TPA: hypothetical protein VFR13_04215 [Jiangellaceae bacterium]|nr:hypothetical protein [Jiangellaceae bacterium]